jgi:hypothetical protein
MPVDTTVYQAKVQAINLATKTLVQNRISGKVIHYYCDNQAAIHLLGNVLVQSPLVQNTVYLLNNLGRKNQVHIFWVKAHVGTIGNEKADCLAKIGAQMHYPSRFQTAPSLCIQKTLTKQAMRQDWQRQWTGLTTCRQTKLFFPSLHEGKSKQLLCKGRILLGTLTQFITGFNHLGYHVLNMKKCEDDTCRLCLESVEDSWHLASECPATLSTRVELWGPFGPSNHSWTVKQLCQLTNRADVLEILSTRPI